MVRHIYTFEEHTFLKNYIPGHTYKEIVAAYNEKFSEPITVSRLKGYMANHKINNGLTGRFKKGNVPYNKGKHTTTVGRMGETQFKKGNLPHNTKPIGYERITKDGYVEVKIAMRPSDAQNGHNFIPKHRLVWEQAYGPIPPGSKVIFKDSNKNNFELDNLALVTNAENLQLTRLGLRSDTPELTETGVLVARVSVITSKFKKNGQRKEC